MTCQSLVTVPAPPGLSVSTFAPPGSSGGRWTLDALIEAATAPFRTWYRIAVVRQTIRDLSACHPHMLRDIGGHRSKIAVLVAMEVGSGSNELRRHD